ncbi:hypothetical protein [Curtobacterium sp. MCBD17_040]|uniref:hypothetical protein n=1 Tax=Curtobacterium sp. MCBD17_040 TaxID=2175674 RepID=UPI000DA94F87|nr:hypothetical protein [Curtobacterium sp. MCBD17_040]WIB65703.1 hypothetical protein DEI94_16410 [Curtobacterium sp. MCBD17_040]
MPTESDSRGQHRYASIDDALRERRLPLENHLLIKSFVHNLGVTHLYETTTYIRGVRPGGPDLQIASGWSNGFTEEEVQRFAGDAESIWLNDDRDPLWGLTHPQHGGHAATSRAQRVRDGGHCELCGWGLAMSGACNNRSY